ncbi:hypothetical protein S58_61680 [Bradyrhizobium oligotrophicum S58]|uniref:Uncharacterized protein n=1 Tax=Bradyrhizobium oligotrophicum S58 TaxID=1245469 RepID=M4ZE80_9BRAD|nr:hypothetical protein [Bradyrhizobium oligotrophicum]BAM92142.1 hypothetical protein S58_61680 [Bradyrhizobium oligotrophicum S58]
MSNFKWPWRIVLVVVAFAPARAQEQKTLGACSPAIASVQGDVSVTCITGDRRIRIAKYLGEIDADKGLKLGSFLEANCGHIVHVHAWAGALGKGQRYSAGRDFAYLELERKSHEAQCVRLDKPDVSDDCLSMDVDFTNENGAVKTANRYHGSWVYEGYYIVSCNGIFTGTQSVTLRQVDDKEVLLSDKYDTNVDPNATIMHGK